MRVSRSCVWRHAKSLVAPAIALVMSSTFAPPRAPAACVGDCNGDGEVTVNELIVMVNIALGTAQLASCPAGDLNGDGEITVNEIISGVNGALGSCPMDTPTPTPTEEPSVAPTLTATEAPAATLTATVPQATASPTPSPTQNGALSVADAVARDGDGKAVHLGQTITTEGVVTVAAGVFANNKLKVFMQEGGAGIMVYHQSSAAVDAYQAGQRLRATGVIRQQDPTSDANPATGTVAVDITQGAAVVVSDGNALPEPQLVTLATLNATGTAYTGTIVRVDGAHKVSGSWPTAGSKSTQVGISDDEGNTTAVLRFQRNTITPQLVSELNAIGNGAFTLTGIVVQDDGTNDGKLLSGFEIWVRGADDIAAP